jgi:hypothetical protein
VKILRSTSLIVSILIGIFCIHTYSYAVDDGLSIGLQDTDITVTTVPRNPQPFQNVTISISSYSTDLNKASIIWRNGANILLSGYGKTSYSFKATGPNTTTTFDIVITTLDTGDRVTKRISITPSEVALLWEAVDGYTPPFYRGKAFVTSEGYIRTVAIPTTNTNLKGSGNVSYTWKSAGKTVQSASGFNKNSYVFKNSELDDVESINVVASSVDSSYNAENNIDIPIIQPKVIFYEKKAGEGIVYNTALSNDTFMQNDQMTIIAEPYYLALHGNESDFSYKWKINGDDIDTPSKKTELTIHPATRGGYATIDIVLENMNAFFQKVEGQLKLTL